MGLEDMCPDIGQVELEQKIIEEVGMDQFLFYRIAQGDDLDWIMGAPRPGYEMHCTACRQDFFEEKGKTAAKHLEFCPRCQSSIIPRRWNDRKCLDDIQFSYHFFQRGDGSDVWLRAFQVRCDRNFENGYKFDLFEYDRILFQTGRARRWTRTRNYWDGVKPWEERKKVLKKSWHGQCGNTRSSVFGGVTEEEMAGSCLQYAQAQEAFDTLNDPVEYLGLYVKYPVCEYLWKMGFGDLFHRRENNGAGFQQVVNLRAKSPDKLLRGLSRAEIKLFRNKGLSFEVYTKYRMLRDAGACRADNASVEFARAASYRTLHLEMVATDCNVSLAYLRKYYEKQSRRSGLMLQVVMGDHQDYLRQLRELDIADGDVFPPDLHGAHERLSMRISAAKTARRNAEFRIRRRLLEQYRFSWNGMLIRPIDSETELICEGEKQRNCVAGYAQRHVDGSTAIFVLRHKNDPSRPFCTVEFNEKGAFVPQCRAYRNADAPPEAQEFIKRWLNWIAVKKGIYIDDKGKKGNAA